MSDTGIINNPRPIFMLDGQAASDELLGNLQDARVERPLNAPARATLRFYDPVFKLIDGSDIEIAKALAIKFESEGHELVSVFDGEIVAIATDQGPSGMHELVVTALDLSHRLGRQTQPKTYLNQSAADIVRSLATAVGMSVSIAGLSTTQNPYTLQTTDALAFLGETARRGGAQWRVDGKQLVVFAPPKSGPPIELTWGDDLYRFRTRFSPTEWNDSVTVRGWDPASKKEIVGTSSNRPSFLSSAPLAANGRAKAGSFGAAVRDTNATVVTSQAEADVIAAAYRARAASVELIARGECDGVPHLAPGELVKIRGVGTKLSGNYYVTEVDHVFTTRGYTTRFVGGTMTPSTIADLMAAQRPSGSLGATIGVVSNNNDPDGVGRVKVKFPTAGDNIESDWARVVTPASGGATGLMFHPSVGDEVLVLFEQGDTRRAFVVGGVWNGKDKPPIATDKLLDSSGKVTRWGMVTPGGHSLLFCDDEAGKERLDILLKDGTTKLTVGANKVELVANSKPLEVKSGQASIVFSDQGDITIKGKSVTIEAQTDVKVKGVNVESTGTAGVKAKAPMIEFTADASLKAASSGITEIKGSIVKVN